MLTGCSARPAAPPPRSSLLRSTQRPARCSPGIPGASSSVTAWRLRILAGGRNSWTADRREFIGRNATLDRPAALAGAAPLSNRVGAGLDPCGALQNRLELRPNSTSKIVFLLGETATKAEAQALIGRYRTADLAAVLATVTRLWDETLATVQVKTPDRAMDILLNRWLLYQTLACRVLGAGGVLPGKWRIRVPRPTAGRHGALRVEAEGGA